MRTRIIIGTAALAATIIVTGCSPVSDDIDDADPGTGPVVTAEPDEGSARSADTDLATTDMEVSATDAIATATEEVGGGDVTKIELDHSDAHSAWAYSVDVRDGDQQHEVTVDAASGAVLGSEADTESDPVVTVDPESPMTPAEAMEAAQSAQQGSVSGWSLESDDGAVVYQVDVRDGNGDVDVVVDVASGDVRVDD